MYRINSNYQKLPGSYLFSTIAKKVAAFTKENPEKQVIRLGIGDVTRPLPEPRMGAEAGTSVISRGSAGS